MNILKILGILSVGFGLSACSHMQQGSTGTNVAVKTKSFHNQRKVASADFGLECTMTYKSSNPFNTSSNSETRWLSAKEVMVGTADSVEFAMKGGAHSIYVNKKMMNRGQDGWSIRVYDDKKVDLGTTEFRQDEAVKVVYPVKAWAQGSEDPPKFDLLEVTCHYTIFAG